MRWRGLTGLFKSRPKGQGVMTWIPPKPPVKTFRESRNVIEWMPLQDDNDILLNDYDHYECDCCGMAATLVGGDEYGNRISIYACEWCATAGHIDCPA